MGFLFFLAGSFLESISLSNTMPNHLIVWDIETVPDLRGFAVANGHDGKADHEIREAMGDKFPKAHLPLHNLHWGFSSSPGQCPLGSDCSGGSSHRGTLRERTHSWVRQSDRGT